MGGTNEEHNIVRISHNVHVALHGIFENRLPHQQIERLLNIGESALREEFKDSIRRELSKHADYIYERGILRKR